MTGEIIQKQGIVLPCFTAVQLSAMVGVAEGSFVFDTTNNRPAVYLNGVWRGIVVTAE